MIIYKIRLWTPHDGNGINWKGSYKEAKELLDNHKKGKEVDPDDFEYEEDYLRAKKDDDPDVWGGIEKVEFRCNKEGILEMLDLRTPRFDNG